MAIISYSRSLATFSTISNAVCLNSSTFWDMSLNSFVIIDLCDRLLISVFKVPSSWNHRDLHQFTSWFFCYFSSILSGIDKCRRRRRYGSKIICRISSFLLSGPTLTGQTSVICSSCHLTHLFYRNIFQDVSVKAKSCFP